MKPLFLILFLLFPVATFGLPDKPKPENASRPVTHSVPKPFTVEQGTHANRNLLLADSAMFASSFINARAAWSGAHQCVIHEEIPRNPGRVFRHSLELSLPVDAAVALVSWKLRKHHPQLALSLPVFFASAQIGAAITEYLAGCN